MENMEKTLYHAENPLTDDKGFQYMVLKKGFKQMTVPVPANIYREFKINCKNSDQTMAQVVRRFIRNYNSWINEEQQAKMHKKRNS